jgi:hypothetical protein
MAGTDPSDATGGTAEPGDDAAITVPSGQKVTLMETIWNIPGPEGLAVRFRFLAPAISKEAGTITADQADADIQALCHQFAAKRIGDATGPKPAQIIISLSDRPVPFGESHPEATQYFDSFTYQDGDCVWSMF